MAINKVVLNNEVQLDLTADTVDASHLATGYTAHNSAGTAPPGIPASVFPAPGWFHPPNRPRQEPFRPGAPQCATSGSAANCDTHWPLPA